MQPMDLWPAPHRTSAFSAWVALPGSKSLTNRELVLSALADGPSMLLRPLVSRDTELMAAALEQLGAMVERDGDHWRVTPLTVGSGITTHVDCGLAGTVMRFVPPIAALLNGSVTFDGDERARMRPMKITLDSLRALGIKVEGNDSLPFTVHGTGEVAGGELTIDASSSSQFVSALLLAAPKFKNGIELHHHGERLPSLPHIEMTLECLAQRGVSAHASGNNWSVSPGPIQATVVSIEPDLSNAGVFIGAALVVGGTVRIQHWPQQTTQAGDRWREIATSFGATTKFDNGDLVFEANGRPKAVHLDLGDVGELTPVIAAVAAFADGPSELSNISHLRGHETDRLAALEEQLETLGCEVEQTDSGLRIIPGEMRAATLLTYDDHRMAHAAAILGLGVPGIQIENIATTSKTYPDFTKDWEAFVS